MFFRRLGGVPISPSVEFVSDLIHMVRFRFVLDDSCNVSLKFTCLSRFNFVPVRRIYVTCDVTETNIQLDIKPVLQTLSIMEQVGNERIVNATTLSISASRWMLNSSKGGL